MVTGSQQLCGEGPGLGQGEPLLAHSASGTQGGNARNTTKEWANGWQSAWLLLDTHAAEAPRARGRCRREYHGDWGVRPSTRAPQFPTLHRTAARGRLGWSWAKTRSPLDPDRFSEDSILLKDKPRNTKLSKHNKSKSSPRALLNRVYSTELGLTGALQGQTLSTLTRRVSSHCLASVQRRFPEATEHNCLNVVASH